MRLPSHFFRLWLPATMTAALLLPPAISAKEPPGKESTKCMAWRFEGEKATVYIVGSIHLFREEDYPLPAPYLAAYEDAAKLAFEIPPGEVSSPETARKMIAAGTYSDGTTLDDHLGKETLKAVDAYFEKSGSPAALKRLRPWMLALRIAVMEPMKLGAMPQFGIDHHFGGKAAKDGKPTEGLETVEEQVAVFASLPEDVQEQMLKKTLADLPKIKGQFDALLGHWKTGDTKSLHKMMFEDADDFPELMDSLLMKRNRNWIDQIVGYLEGDENVMVVVGAGHLAGEGSVVELLEKKGFKGAQLSYLAAAEKAEK